MSIAFSVNCFARYMFIPRISHALAFKMLEQYLKNTQDLGLVLDPNYDIFKVDSYLDAYFARMYKHEIHDDPACSKSLAGFIIKFSDCPVLCISKFQTETALSTMEAEIFSLDSFCRELFPIINIT